MRPFAALLVIAIIVATACSSSAPTPAPPAAFATIIDETTVVVREGIDLYGNYRTNSVTTATPTTSEVAAVLAQVDETADLAWAGSHTRAIYAVIDNAERRIEVAFACGLAPITTPEGALVAAREAANPPLGGGNCYGRALFTPQGELLSWRTNGES